MQVYLHILPLCHIGSLSSALANIMVGASHVILPKFQAVAVFDAIKEHRVTSMVIIPAMLADVVAASKTSNRYGFETNAGCRALNLIILVLNLEPCDLKD